MHPTWSVVRGARPATAPTATGATPAARIGTPGTACRRGPSSGGDQRICIPEMAREMTSRWISEVPSKMV
ncbi:hypothetical protein TPA0908_00930 [Micromonospora sp. AKA38]|nr:hypothetical protein TPA0908_00930 [Micromonospora sp. AKA38]